MVNNMASPNNQAKPTATPSTISRLIVMTRDMIRTTRTATTRQRLRAQTLMVALVVWTIRTPPAASLLLALQTIIQGAVRPAGACRAMPATLSGTPKLPTDSA